MKKMQRTIRKRKWDVAQLKTKEKALTKEIEDKIGDMRGHSVEDRWTELKNAVTDSAKSVIGYTNRKPARKPWVSKEMIDKMAERRK